MRCRGGVLSAFAYDIMATFLLKLVQENKDELRAKLEKSNSIEDVGTYMSDRVYRHNGLFDIISSILAEQKVIEKDEAVRIVLAAFLASDLFPPEPLSRQKEDE
jgi:hypothetical protein